MGSLLQFAVTTSATVTETFTVDGAPTDLDAGVPAVALTKPDGTVVTPAPTVSGAWSGRTTGQYRFVLAGLPKPTVLAGAWTGTIGGQPQTLHTTIEILGADLFGITELRALKVAGGTPFSLTATPLFSDAQLHAARAAVGDELTQILGYPPVPRFARELLDGNGRADLFVSAHKTVELLSVTVDGTAQTLADFTLADTGQLSWTAGRFTATKPRTVAVEYVHGMPTMPGDGGRVAQLMAAAQLLPDGFQTTTTASFPDGSTYTYEPSETGRAGFVRHTGIRVVDRWLNRWAEPRVVMA